jgi:F-type H+-transporting ATPase subunit b
MKRIRLDGLAVASARAILLVILFGSFFVWHLALLRAESQTSASAPASDSQKKAAKRRDSLPAQLARESREAAGEDENAAFKHSPAVQLVARWTGLSLEHAYWLCILLNFGVVAGVIGWLVKNNLPGAFRNRTAAIQKALEEARRASADANQRLTEIESRLSRLDAEIGRMEMAAEQEATAEDQRLQAAGAEDARKVVESAEQEIAAAAKAIQRELTAYAAGLAVSLAEKQIRVDPSTDQALVREFAAQLSVGVNGDRKGRS